MPLILPSPLRGERVAGGRVRGLGRAWRGRIPQSGWRTGFKSLQRNTHQALGAQSFPALAGQWRPALRACLRLRHDALNNFSDLYYRKSKTGLQTIKRVKFLPGYFAARSTSYMRRPFRCDPRYIRNNPVLATLCWAPEEWPWSSAAFCSRVQQGGLPIRDTADWQSALRRKHHDYFEFDRNDRTEILSRLQEGELRLLEAGFPRSKTLPMVVAVRPGFEPGQKPPKGLVLPLHHRTKLLLS